MKEIQEHNEFGYRFMGYFDDPETSMAEVTGSLHEVKPIAQKIILMKFILRYSPQI